MAAILCNRFLLSGHASYVLKFILEKYSLFRSEYDLTALEWCSNESVCSDKCTLNGNHETCQWLKFPPNGLRAQSRVIPVVGLLPSASGPACLGNK